MLTIRAVTGTATAEWERFYQAACAAESGTAPDTSARFAGRWEAFRDDSLAGVATATPQHDATFVRVFVRDGDRRVGVGRALFEAVRATPGPGTFRAVVLAHQAGAHFAESLGASVVARLVVMELRLDGPATTAPSTAPLPAGYDFRSWTGPAPPALLDSYADAKRHIADAPHASAQLDADWTPARVRAAESSGRFVGAALYDGRVVAFTEIDTSPTSSAASQEDTVVAPDHRGRGLALAVKSALAARLRVARPDIVSVTSTISAENVPMLATSRALGWVEARRRFLVELTIGRDSSSAQES